MSIKQNGGVFGRNPTFNDVTIEGDLIINGEVFTGLDFQGSWNASTNSPTLASSVGTNGEFYIVSIAGGTNLNGITNWGIGDWAIFNGTAWQRVEGGADGNFNDVTVAGTLGVTGEITANGGIALGDNDKATFGASDDLEIYHDGSGSRISDIGTGNLLIQGTNLTLADTATGENFLTAVSNDAVKLFHNGSNKIATTATGIDVTGTATMDGLSLDNAQYINFKNSSNVLTRSLGINGANTFYIGGIDADIGDILFVDGGTTRASFANGGDISFYEDTGTTAKLFWDASAESLGIGTGTPNAAIEIRSNAGQSKRALRIAYDGTYYYEIKQLGSGGVAYNAVNATAGGHRFEIDGTERLRIDYSGNLLVGKTAVSLGVVGVEVKPNGEVRTTASGAQALQLNRLSSDGTIIDFRKDGTTVGSIGSESGTSFIDGHATASGIRFDTFGVLPRKSGAIANNSVDLGSATTAWQDLYLSSGVYLGGTGAANKLDDYEEGTWTPTITNSTGSYTAQVGRYTKIGNLVYVNCNVNTAFTNTGTTSQNIEGLPFASENVSLLFSVGTIFPVQGFNQGNSDIAAQSTINTTSVALYTVTPTTSINYTRIVSNTFGTTVEFEFSLCYRTA
jgi:hypothetical protein